MQRLIFILSILCLTHISYSATTIIPTDNTQSNLRDAYRLVLQKAAHPWTREGQVAPILEVNGRPYYGEVPVLWSMDENHYPGSFIIPDTLTASGITTLQTFFPDLEYAFSLTFTEQEVTVFVLKSSIADTSVGTCSWEYPYFEQFLVNTLNLRSQVHYQLVNETEFSQRILDDLLFQSSPASAKILLIPAFSYGNVTLGQYMEESINKHPRFASALNFFLQNGGTIYTEGNAAYLLEAAALLPEGTVDLENTIDGIGTDMLASVQSVWGNIPPGYSNQLYTSQGPTIHDSLHAVAIFTQVADAEDVGKPAVVLIEEPNLCGSGRIILNVGMPAVGSMVVSTSSQWQWLANALFLAFAERLDLVRSVYVETDSLHPDPMSLPAGVETMFEVTIQLRNLWNKESGDIEVVEHYKPYFDYVDVSHGPAPMVDETNHTLTFSLSSLGAHQREMITYRLRSPGQGDQRVEHIDDYLDYEINMKVSSSEFSFGDPVFNDKKRTTARNDIWVRFLFEARIVADLDLNWKNILGHYYQPFKIFTTMENKERTPAVTTQVVHYAPLDIPVYKTAAPLIPIERTPPGQFMDLLRWGGDLDGDAATDGPDVGFDLSSIFPEAASVETVRVFWRNPWTGKFDDYDRDGQVTTDADSDGVYETIDDGDRLTALKIIWKPGLGTETEGTIPGYQFYDPFCYWEIWIDPPDEVQMAIGAAKQDTITFAVTDSIYTLDSFFYEHWERWMEHNEQGNVIQTRLVKRRRQDYEGFALVDSSYILKPDDVDYGWIPKPIRSSVFFLALGGRGPSMTNPLTEYSELSTITYQTIWGRKKETPLRCAYTYYAPLPNPLQFEYISKTFHITDPKTGARLYELPAHRNADLTFDITISTEYSLYWITNVTPDNNHDDLGDGIYSYVIEQIPKGLGGYSVDLPRTQRGEIDTQAVADPPPTAIWEGPFYWQIYWDSLRIPAALDDDNGDGIDDWLDDTGDRFFNPVDSAYLYDAFPPGTGAWLPGPDGAYGDDLCEALGAKGLKVYATFHGQGREGSLKINDGAWLVNEEIFGGPPWVQFSHVQEAWAVGHNIQARGKPDPTFINLHQNPVYEKFYITDVGEPHSFDILFDPWLKSYGDETATATVYLGGKDPCHQINPDVALPARVNRNNVPTLTFFPGVDPADFPGYPKQGSGLFVQTIVELNNNEKIEAVFDTSGNEIGHCAKTHWYNVTVTPNLLGLGNTEIFVSYCAYPRPLVPGDDFRTLRAGWRFNPSPMEVLIKMGNPDGSATIPEIQSSRRGYFVFTFKIDPTLPDGCYRIPFTLQGTARAYHDSTGGVPLSFPIPEARFSLSDGSLQPFIIGEAEITDIRDVFKPYVNLGPIPDVRWTEGTEPTEATFNALPMATAFQQDTTLVIRPPVLKFPSEQGAVDTDFWLMAHSLVDVPNGGENIPLDTGLRLSYKDHFGADSTIVIPPLTINARGADILLSTRLIRVNGEAVADTSFLLRQGQNTLTVALDFHCIGNDLARTPILHQILGPTIQLQQSTWQPAATTALADGRKRLEWNLPDFIPGSSRRLELTLSLPYVETQGSAPILICDSTYVYYENLVSVDTRQIWYALDLSIAREGEFVYTPAEPTPGDNVRLSATIHRSGTAIARDVVVRFYNGDPTDNNNRIGDVLLSEFAGSDTSVAINWQIPGEGALVFDFYLRIDPDNRIGELSETNNIASSTMSASKTLTVSKLITYPNPFETDTEFIFELSQRAEVSIKIYTMEGRLIKTIACGTCEVGYNTVYWDGQDDDGDLLPNGTYVYKIVAKNEKGQMVKREYVVKMR